MRGPHLRVSRCVGTKVVLKAAEESPWTLVEILAGYVVYSIP